MGLVYEAQGRHAEALKYYQEALTTRLEVGDQVGAGETLNNIGVVYHAQERYAEALKAHQQALDLGWKLSDPIMVGMALNNIGVVYHAQGRYAEALDVYQQALAILQKGGSWTSKATTLSGIGLVYEAQGRHAEAVEVYQQALVVAQDMGDRVGEGKTLNNIGFAYQQRGEADQALAYYKQAMDIFESLRAIAGSEAGRASFAAQYSGLYDRAVGLYHQQGQEAQAFHTSERGRARTFLDSLTTDYLQLSDTASADLLDREQSAYAALRSVQDALAQARAQDSPDLDLITDLTAQLNKAAQHIATLNTAKMQVAQLAVVVLPRLFAAPVLGPPDPDLAADLEAQVRKVEEGIATLDTIEASSVQLAALALGRSAVLELVDVQAMLDERTTLVSYYILGDEGALAFVITRQDMSVVELPEATPDNLRSALADIYQWPNLENPHPLPLRNLHAWLVTPLTDHLHTEMVGIIPHQALHYVPFAALTDGQTYFGQQHTVFTLPSASALPFIQANASQAHGAGALIFGNPATGDTNLRPLAHAAAEAKAVADQLGVPAYTGADASEFRLSSDASGARVVHLAAHGGYNTANPLYSTIYLVRGPMKSSTCSGHAVHSSK